MVDVVKIKPSTQIFEMGGKKKVGQKVQKNGYKGDFNVQNKISKMYLQHCS